MRQCTLRAGVRLQTIPRYGREDVVMRGFPENRSVEDGGNDPTEGLFRSGLSERE